MRNRLIFGHKDTYLDKDDAGLVNGGFKFSSMICDFTSPE